MLKTIFKRVMWLARGTSMVLGLALMLALVMGVATMALAAVPGDPFKLGKTNTINKLSKLVGSGAGPMLRIDNNGTGPALDLQVEQDKAPLTVNPEAGTATGLSADKLDGKDSIDISSVYYLTKQGGVPLATGGNTGTQVATLSGLPAGDYLLTANVVAVNFSPPDFVRCNLEVGGTSYPGSTATPGVSSGFSNAASQITTTAAVALTSSGDATLSCLHDTSGRTPSVESIRIYAIRTGELHAQTVP